MGKGTNNAVLKSHCRNTQGPGSITGQLPEDSNFQKGQPVILSVTFRSVLANTEMLQKGSVAVH